MFLELVELEVLDRGECALALLVVDQYERVGHHAQQSESFVRCNVALFVHALRGHVADLDENALVVVDLLETGLECGGDAVLIGDEEVELVQLLFFVTAAGGEWAGSALLALFEAQGAVRI
jgi:hypothetical protein